MRASPTLSVASILGWFLLDLSRVGFHRKKERSEIKKIYKKYIYFIAFCKCVQGLIMITNISFWLLLSQDKELRMHWFLLIVPIHIFYHSSKIAGNVTSSTHARETRHYGFSNVDTETVINESEQKTCTFAKKLGNDWKEKCGKKSTVR